MTADKVTRFAVDLLASAAVEGARQSRSAKQQLDHWARVGRAVSMHETSARRRVEAVLAGAMPMSELRDEELLVANAELDATIQRHAQGMSFGDRLAAEGVTTVALGEDGSIIAYHPDGSRTPVAG